MSTLPATGTSYLTQALRQELHNCRGFRGQRSESFRRRRQQARNGSEDFRYKARVLLSRLIVQKLEHMLRDSQARIFCI